MIQTTRVIFDYVNSDGWNVVLRINSTFKLLLASVYRVTLAEGTLRAQPTSVVLVGERKYAEIVSYNV